MRANHALVMFGVACGLSLGACGPGSYAVEPLTADSDCYAMEQCPLLAGGEVFGRAVFHSDVTESLRPKSVSISPPELGEAYVSGDYIVIRPAAIAPGNEPSVIGLGGGELHVVLEDGADFYQYFTVAPRATTAVVPDRSGVPLDVFPERKLPGERLAMFQGESLVVTAEHRTADGTRLIGHTDDSWLADGVQLAELDQYYGSYDTTLIRRIRAITAGSGSVAMSGASLPLDVVAPRTSARLEVLDNRKAPLGIAALYSGQNYVSLLAYAADGRYIYGGPPFIPVTVTSSDPTVISVGDRQIYPDRDLSLTGYRSGTATLTFAFDGLSIDVPVSVE